MTVLFTAPTAYRAIMEAGAVDRLAGLRRCVSAGEALPAAVWHEFHAATGLRIIDGIGATEMLHVFISAADEDIRPGSTGRPVPGYRAAVVDEHGDPVPDGQPGLLAVTGPTGCRYLADPRQASYVRNGWNITGDTYIRDAEGYFWYVARSDDMIVSSGYNIAGPEVEKALATHPYVEECAVVGAPDTRRGMVVKAYVVLGAGVPAAEGTVRELQAHVKQTIAPYKYPRAVEFVTELPRTGTGKLRRGALRERALSDAAAPAPTAPAAAEEAPAASAPTAPPPPPSSLQPSVVVERRVEWTDTDAAGHYHHSTVVRWVEAAEAVLLHRLGLSHLFGSTPRVHFEADYRARLWFGDAVRTELKVTKVGSASCTTPSPCAANRAARRPPAAWSSPIRPPTRPGRPPGPPTYGNGWARRGRRNPNCSPARNPRNHQEVRRARRSHRRRARRTVLRGPHQAALPALGGHRLGTQRSRRHLRLRRRLLRRDARRHRPGRPRDPRGHVRGVRPLGRRRRPLPGLHPHLGRARLRRPRPPAPAADPPGALRRPGGGRPLPHPGPARRRTRRVVRPGGGVRRRTVGHPRRLRRHLRHRPRRTHRPLHVAGHGQGLRGVHLHRRRARLRHPPGARVPYDATRSTFIVEMEEEAWRRAGFEEFAALDHPPGTSDDDSIRRCEELLADHLDGHRLLPNNSKWLRFTTVRNRTWRHENVVLLGDAAHTAHFSIGSGTKLAMEDALVLAASLHEHPDVPTALAAYEEERRPVVESTQRAAQASLEWFEHIDRYTGQDPYQFAFNLLTRSRRVTYDNLRVRDEKFTTAVNRSSTVPPMFRPYPLGGLLLRNRVVVPPTALHTAREGVPGDFDLVHLSTQSSAAPAWSSQG